MRDGRCNVLRDETDPSRPAYPRIDYDSLLLVGCSQLAALPDTVPYGSWPHSWRTYSTRPRPGWPIVCSRRLTIRLLMLNRRSLRNGYCATSLSCIRLLWINGLRKMQNPLTNTTLDAMHPLLDSQMSSTRNERPRTANSNQAASPGLDSELCVAKDNLTAATNRLETLLSAFVGGSTDAFTVTVAALGWSPIIQLCGLFT